MGGDELMVCPSGLSADVELDLVESCESEGAAERARAAAEAVAVAERMAKAARKDEQEDRWSIQNSGVGQVLGGGPENQDNGEAKLSDREKRLAALERRGLN